MPHCAFLSTDELEEFFVYDDLVKPFLYTRGWTVEDVSWRDTNVDYNAFDLVIVRSTWDYQTDAEAFLKCLARIESSSAILENPLSLMKWNVSKSYLCDLDRAGVPILPTLWHVSFEESIMHEAFDHFNAPMLIIKPLISANADHTYQVTKDNLASLSKQLHKVFVEREFMIQAFENSILENGEYSLFYFNGEYSHAICKRPKSGDFRVQEEHGGELESINAAEDMLSLGKHTIEALPEDALYARVDMLNTPNGLAIIEVELIEPSLYFNMSEGSAERFAQAIVNKYG